MQLRRPVIGTAEARRFKSVSLSKNNSLVVSFSEQVPLWVGDYEISDFRSKLELLNQYLIFSEIGRQPDFGKANHMSERMFDAGNPIYKRMEDLPEEERKYFANEDGGGFVRKEAKEEFDEAKKIIELANQFKEAGVEVTHLLDKRRKSAMLKDIGLAIKDNKTAMDIMQERAETEVLKPMDALHAEANEINSQKFPEEIYLEKLKSNPDDLKGIPKRVFNNKRFALEAVKLNRKALDKIGFGQNCLTGNDYVEVVYEAVRHDGLALQYAGNKSRANKDIVLEAVKQNPNAIKFASDDIKEALKRVMQ